MSPVETVPIREAAERLGVHENTIRNWADRRVIRSHRLPTGIRRIPRSEIERLEQEIFAVPTFFPDERVVAAPKSIGGEVHPTRYPDS
ncbi:MAG: helix-turn-helix domain-containing protein [Actinomycetota bacterium]